MDGINRATLYRMQPSFDRQLSLALIVVTMKSILKVEERIGIYGCVSLKRGCGEGLYPNYSTGMSNFSLSLLTRYTTLTRHGYAYTRYRVNPTTFRNARWGNTFVDGFSALQAKVQSKHGSLSKHGAFPVKAPRWSSQLESISWKMPYSNSLDIRGKAIMFVIPWLYVGGADVGALHMIQLFVEAG